MLAFAGLCAAEPVRHQPAPDAAITEGAARRPVTTWQKRAGVTDERVVRVDWTSLAIHIAFFTAAVSLIVMSAGT